MRVAYEEVGDIGAKRAEAKPRQASARHPDAAGGVNCAGAKDQRDVEYESRLLACGSLCLAFLWPALIARPGTEPEPIGLASVKLDDCSLERLGCVLGMDKADEGQPPA